MEENALKTKIKNALLKEYVEICQMQNFFRINHKLNMLNDAEILKKKYEQIFLKIGYIDLAFYILKKEMQDCEKLGGLTFTQSIGFNYDKKLKNYGLSLGLKMKKLFFNEFEINFIENFA